MPKSFPSLKIPKLTNKYLILVLGLVFIVLIIFKIFFNEGSIKKDNYLNHIANKTPDIEKEIYLQVSDLGINVIFVEVFEGNVVIDIVVKEKIISQLSRDAVNVLYTAYEKHPALKQITVRMVGLLENSKEKPRAMCIVFADAEDIEKVKLKYQQPEDVDIIKCFETWLDPSLFK